MNHRNDNSKSMNSNLKTFSDKIDLHDESVVSLKVAIDNLTSLVFELKAMYSSLRVEVVGLHEKMRTFESVYDRIASADSKESQNSTLEVKNILFSNCSTKNEHDAPLSASTTPSKLISDLEIKIPLQVINARWPSKKTSRYRCLEEKYNDTVDTTSVSAVLKGKSKVWIKQKCRRVWTNVETASYQRDQNLRLKSELFRRRKKGDHSLIV